MSDSMMLAVPSLGEGGLEGERSAHFGQCDCFTLVEIADGAIQSVRTVENPSHAEGGCLRPVSLLASHGVDALIVVGMGARPLAGFGDAGITVYSERQTPGIGEAVRLVLDGKAEIMDPDAVCGCH